MHVHIWFDQNRGTHIKLSYVLLAAKTKSDCWVMLNQGRVVNIWWRPRTFCALLCFYVCIFSKLNAAFKCLHHWFAQDEKFCWKIVFHNEAVSLLQIFWNRELFIERLYAAHQNRRLICFLNAIVDIKIIQICCVCSILGRVFLWTVESHLFWIFFYGPRNIFLKDFVIYS